MVRPGFSSPSCRHLSQLARGRVPRADTLGPCEKHLVPYGSQTRSKQGSVAGLAFSESFHARARNGRTFRLAHRLSQCNSAQTSTARHSQAQSQNGRRGGVQRRPKPRPSRFGLPSTQAHTQPHRLLQHVPATEPQAANFPPLEHLRNT